MTQSTANGSLELEVTDFGPIAEARVDLRPLTVFVGPSNTGKSYLAILIYALHRVLSGGRGFANRSYRRSLLFFSRQSRSGLPDECTEALLELADSLKYDWETLVLPTPVAEALQSGFDENADTIAGEIGRCFGIGDIRALTRRGTSNAARIVMRRHLPNAADALEHTVSLARRAELRTKIPAKIPIPVDFEADDGRGRYWRRGLFMLDEFKRDRDGRKLAALEALSFVGDMVLPSLVAPLHLPAYYLPADRTGIMHAHSVVVSALIASAARAGLRPAVRTPMLSGVLADFLEQLIEIDPGPPRSRESDQDLGRSIEKDILGGSVSVDRSARIDYPRFAYRPAGWQNDLALANASSMVSELAPVVLYLRHMVGPGNVLIVEEPESHLHPAMQVAFTRQLVAIVRAGVRVIVTTHSEWLLEELANIVRRSALPGVDCEGDDAGIALRPEQVGIWLFEPKQRPRGSAVREIGLDESGLYPAGYDAVASALHNEWADISGRIEAGS